MDLDVLRLTCSSVSGKLTMRVVELSEKSVEGFRGENNDVGGGDSSSDESLITMIGSCFRIGFRLPK